MVGRLIIRPARILLSRAGVPVSEGMGNDAKIFDSDWDWSGMLLEAGIASDPGGGDWTLAFKKDYGFVPCVVARQLTAAPYGVPWSGPMVKSPSQGLSNGSVAPFIYSNRIVFPRNFSTGGAYNYETVEYEVYGVD